MFSHSFSSPSPLLRSSPELLSFNEKFVSFNTTPPPSIRFRQSKFSSTTTATATAAATAPKTNNMTSSSSLYEVLGISMGASGDEIKSAYRRLARTYHPDVRKEIKSADVFIKINSAYSTLSDPKKRSDYDRTLFRQFKSPSLSSSVSSYKNSSMSGFSGYTSRNWETDQCW